MQTTDQKNPDYALRRAYARGDAAAVREIVELCDERSQSTQEVAYATRMRLFDELRGELVAAAMEHAAHCPERVKVLVAVVQDVMSIVIRPALPLFQGVCNLHRILRDNDMGHLWSIVSRKLDAKYPRFETQHEAEWSRVSRDSDLKRKCHALTILPFLEGGNDAPLVDQMLSVAANGFPKCEYRRPLSLPQVVAFVLLMKKWAKRTMDSGVLEDLARDHKVQARQLESVLQERMLAPMSRKRARGA